MTEILNSQEIIEKLHNIFFAKNGYKAVDLKRTRKDGQPYGGAGIRGTYKSTVGNAKKQGFDPKRNKYKNNKRVAEAQIDRADKGHHPSYRPKNKK